MPWGAGWCNVSAPLLLGAPKHPPLVFLHGFMGRGRSWLEIARPLSANFYCILPSLPGHGRHTHGDPSAPLSFDTLTAWLNTLLDNLNLTRVHLVGYSLGGRAALHFACHHPQRLLSLTLESASPGLLDKAEQARRRAEDDARAADILSMGMTAFVERWYAMPLFASLHAHPRRLARIQAAAARNDPRWMARVVSALSPGRQPPLWDCLPTLSMPILLLAGEQDEKYVQITHRMAARLPPHAQVVIIPRAGHNAHAERPARVRAALSAFLSHTKAAPHPTKNNRT